jgi:hypothetical protein
MNLKFKLKDVFEVDLYYGFYEIFFLGGFDVKANPDFFIEILDLKTNESIVLNEKSLKARDYKHGKRAVKFFNFQISNKSRYKISVHNYEDLIVNYAMPSISSFGVFSLFDFLKIRKQAKIELDEIEILIS